MVVVAAELDVLDAAGDVTLGGGTAKEGSELPPGDRDGGGAGDAACESIHELLLLLGFAFAVLLVIGLLGGGVYEVVVDGSGGIVMLFEPFDGIFGVLSSRSMGRKAASLTVDKSLP